MFTATNTPNRNRLACLGIRSEHFVNLLFKSSQKGIARPDVLWATKRFINVLEEVIHNLLAYHDFAMRDTCHQIKEHLNRIARLGPACAQTFTIGWVLPFEQFFKIVGHIEMISHFDSATQIQQET